jgi:hypothetical protein
MTNPTTPFSWQMPTSSDLVTDLPADFEVFGQAVATSMADLLGGTTGQILAKASNTDMDFTWVANDQGDITGITASSPLTGGGTSGAVTLGILSGTTSNLGAVQLSDSTSSTSTTLAATANAVKAAFDKASTAATTSVAGIVQLSDSTSTTSSVLASTPTATKSAYDLANSAYAPAFTNNFYAGKNKIINGDFSVWQRGTTFATGGGAALYTADRWRIDGGNGAFNAYQTAFTAGAAPVAGYESQFYLLFTGGISTSGTPTLQQRIEDVRTLANQTVTVSFWAKSTSTHPSSITLIQNFGSGGSAEVSTTVATSPTYTGSFVHYSYTVSVPSISGKTIGTSSYLALSFNFPLSAATPAFSIWGVQVEAGSVATPFQTRTGNLSSELVACQRYYQKSYASGIYPGASYPGGYSMTMVENNVAASNYYHYQPLIVQCRTAPSVTIYSGGGSVSKVSTTAGSDLAVDSGVAVLITDNHFSVQNLSGGALTTSAGGFLFFYVVSAEL